ncbi:MAG: hypothetical protein ACLQU1_14850 [Bryobacteraceae bacterium]
MDSIPRNILFTLQSSSAEQTFARLERRRDTLQRAFRRTLQDLRQIQASRPPTETQSERPLGCPPGPSQQVPPQVPPPVPSAGPPQAPEIGFVPESPAAGHGSGPGSGSGTGSGSTSGTGSGTGSGSTTAGDTPSARLDPNSPVPAADFARVLQKLAQKRPASKRRPSGPNAGLPNHAAELPKNAA